MGDSLTGSLVRAEVLVYAKELARMENIMPGSTGVCACASADAMELHDALPDQ